MTDRRCQQCGRSIEHLRKDARFCDSSCRTEASRQRHGVSAFEGTPSFPWSDLRASAIKAARRGRERYATRRKAAA